jgi:hypothetical protein
VTRLVLVELGVSTQVVLVAPLVPADRVGVVELPAAPELVLRPALLLYAHQS